MHAKYNGYSFPLRDTVSREKVRFHNRYGIELCGDLYLPRDAAGTLTAVAVAGPFGAVKEQCAGLHAEELASRGFAALAFDPSFIGESGGGARNVASPDINTEDFCAAVDLSTPRTSAPRWTFSPPGTSWTRSGWASWASAAGAAWP